MRAAKAFEAALRIDPHLIEARMRAGRIRAASARRSRCATGTSSTEAEDLSD
jgi:hypothetical protein